MTPRLWFPQLDVYDTIRRIGSLLNGLAGSSIGVERLYILDFFFANPPLLHRTHMPRLIRNAFSELKIAKPEQGFLSYPSAPLLFHKMEGTQREAMQNLLGKGLIEGERLIRGEVVPSALGTVLFSERLSPLITESELPIMHFLLNEFSTIGKTDIEDFRRSTALRRTS